MKSTLLTICTVIFAVSLAPSFAQEQTQLPRECSMQSLNEANTRNLDELKKGGVISYHDAFQSENDGLIAELNCIRTIAQVERRPLSGKEDARVKQIVCRVASNMAEQWVLMKRVRDAGQLPPRVAIEFLTARANFIMRESEILCAANARSEEYLLSETLAELSRLLEKK